MPTDKHSSPKQGARRASSKYPAKQASKTQTKASAKSSSRQTSKSKSASKQSGSNLMLHQLMPYILGLVALFLIVSYCLAASTGFFGGFLRNLMFGLFSHAAWAVPLLLNSVALFWRRDVESGSVGYKIVFSVLETIFIAVLLQAFACRGESPVAESFNVVELFKMGLDGIGGGVFGGFIGNLLLRGFGFVGTMILSIALILLFGVFMFGMTPHLFLVTVIAGFREWRSGLGTRMSNARAEREEMLLEYETRRAEKLALRGQKAEAAAAAHAQALANERARRDRMEQSSRRRRPMVNDAIFDEDLPSVSVEPYIDECVFDDAQFQDSHITSDPSVNNFVESDAPPFDLNDSDAENEGVDLAKIFSEPNASSEMTEPGIIDDEGAFFTSAELELMVEKSRLASDSLAPEPDDDDDDDEEPMCEALAPEAKLDSYIFPPIQLLKINRETESVDLSGEIQQTATKLVETLRSFNVKTKIINVSRGPTITRYELQPEIGTKVRSIVNLVDDIALHLATGGIRIEAPIPGKEAVGIEVPNRSTATVYIRELLENSSFKAASSKVTTGLGMDVAGNPVFLDVAKMPHLLIAGTTGSGKSVCINSLIISMLYKARPDEVKFIMIDPKKVELNVYNGIPHLLVPVVSDPKKAAGSLHWAVTEMERRYDLIEGAGVRNLKGYNQSIANDPDAEQLPQIVIIIDELADLMMMARDDVEESICRIAQKARAAGMHLILGTQRPTVDVVTGLIKANVPSRIAFTTMSQIDSRTIIDTVGAEKLIGRGDMLYAPIGAVKPTRVQGCFVSDEEVEEVTTFIKNNYGVRDYDKSVMETIEKEALLCGNKRATIAGDGDVDANDGDPMLNPAIELAVESGKISTSLIQRRLQLGYGRAAKLIDTMEDMGIVGPPQGQKPRDVLISHQEYMEMKLRREG